MRLCTFVCACACHVHLIIKTLSLLCSNCHINDYFFLLPPPSPQAEYARGEGQTKVIVRAPHPGRPTTWTGEGFMEVHEGDKIDFEISNLGQSMEYEIVVRYEPQVHAELGH